MFPLHMLVILSVSWDMVGSNFNTHGWITLCFPLSISGGYNLKTGANSNIENMKNDMGGAAALLGAAKAIGEIKPLDVEVNTRFFHSFPCH